ncbi:MAG TPA: sugar nucleotide-binding protein [Burkholderiales bacterium]|nr:sugar nucleotide-binding protein [Burkholderiales bacterium]
MTRIAVLGQGFIGGRLHARLENATLLAVDITDRRALAETLRDGNFDVVINTAAKTGRPNVDWCESHQSETLRANVIGALTVAEVCEQLGAYLLHLGSACVFFGRAPHGNGWAEDDFANPQSFYTRTKYAAELVLEALPNVAIVRVRLPLDNRPGPRNFITKLAAYRTVVDATNSATVVDDLVSAIDTIVSQRATGVFHATNPGLLTNQRVLELYRKYVDPRHQYELVTEAELYARGLAIAPRSNCEVACTRLEELGVRFEHIDSALDSTLRKYGEHFRSERY